MSAGEAMTAAYKAFRSERSDWGVYSAESIEFCIRYGTGRIVQLWDVNFRYSDYAMRHESLDPSVGIRVDCATGDRKSTRLNSSHIPLSRMPSSA